MAVLLRNESGDRRVCPAMLRRDAEAMLAAAGIPEAELSILITGDEEIRRLNRDHRGKDKPTNVLSYPQDDDTEPLGIRLLGDIVISSETAAVEAAARGIGLNRRLQRLLAHGFVHLLGFDHEISDEEAARMSAEEKRFMTILDQQRRKKMVSLAINVDHVATLRQARGGIEPDPVTAAALCELAGAEGIVVHLREDRRHIQDRDVRLLRQTVKSKLNLEMGATEEIISIALDVGPDMVTLVPEKRQELTTEGGLDVAGQEEKIGKAIEKFSAAGIPVSLFIDPDAHQIKAAAACGATFAEIHTGRYSDAPDETTREKEFNLIADAAEAAFEAGLRVNAGHGLDYLNTAPVAALPMIEELSIGHAVMARAVMVGLEKAVREMREIIFNATF